MSPSLRTAVILCAGLGTRFLPITKSIPKAMLPIIDKPVIHYLVEEAVASGFNRIVMVIGPDMEAIERYFLPLPALEDELKQKGKEELLPLLRPFEGVEFHFLIQEEARGDGHAILMAQNLLEDEPFAVLFGDDILAGETPGLQQLKGIYEATHSPVMASLEVPTELVSQYGVIDPVGNEAGALRVQGLIEKPDPEEAPSNHAVVGKYICTPEVLTHLKKGATSRDGEQRLIEAFRSMLESGHSLYALPLEGRRFDTGSKQGLLEANLYFAKKHSDINPSSL